MSPSTVLSSNLLELHVHVLNFADCLYLLDGRFNQLHTFHVNISYISSNTLTINNTEKLPNLRCFSLYCDIRTYDYDELIVPLLHRMLNLEKLDLHLNNVVHDKGFIDGNNLKENIINYMPQLNKFTFNIRSFKPSPNIINLPSNEDIQHTFKEFKNNQIISCVDYFQKRQCGCCHVYSYPYRMKYYDNITNNFPGGLLKYVQTVQLYDDYPFEYEFFRRIAQSFPSSNNTSSTNTWSSTKGSLVPAWQAPAYVPLDTTLSRSAPKPIGQLRHLINPAAQETNVHRLFLLSFQVSFIYQK
ncbi:unnamed protein product [Rotaria sordida]|uniref:Uncharacterized protein n=1 Tax=Rotaria sordida TaxID=392033 RepID=A0A819ETZ1_9BILA|nr:unnamed protein product [Rotaria sordida]